MGGTRVARVRTNQFGRHGKVGVLRNEIGFSLTDLVECCHPSVSTVAVLLDRIDVDFARENRNSLGATIVDYPPFSWSSKLL